MTISNQINRKQLAAISQFLVIVVVACVLFQIRLAESRTYRKELSLLIALKSLSETRIHIALLDTTEDGDSTTSNLRLQKEIQSGLINWLEKNHPQVDESRRIAREKIADWLASNGLNPAGLSSLSGKSGSTDKESPAFLLFKLHSPSFESELQAEANIRFDPPVDLLIDEAEFLVGDCEVTIVTSISDANVEMLPSKLSTVRWEQGTFSIDHILLSDDEIVEGNFTENIGPAQSLPSTETRQWNVAETRQLRATLFNMFDTSQLRSRLESLPEDVDTVKTIRRKYGELRINQALDVASEHSIVGFEEIEMLGFTFSPQHFWIGVHLSIALLLGGVLVHISFPSSSEGSESLLGLSIIIQYWAVRIVLWVCMPTLSIYLAAPTKAEERGLFFWGSAVSVVCMGIVCCAFAQRISSKFKVSSI